MELKCVNSKPIKKDVKPVENFSKQMEKHTVLNAETLYITGKIKKRWKMEITNVPIKELKFNEKNPRKITRQEMTKLMRSIQEFGFVDPVIVNKHETRYNIIVGGHQRVQAAEKLGITEVPVTYVELNEEKEQLLNIALNQISGEWDDDKLFELLKELEERGADLSLSGLEEPALDKILAVNKKTEKEKTIDQTPAKPEEPKSKKGEIWLLGNHRLMCGDSTEFDDVHELMNKKIADLCWTDPPYGVSYKGTNNPNGREWDVLKNDDLRDNELYDFLFKIFKNVAVHTKPNAAIYTCYASVNHIIFENALKEAGIQIKQTLIWEKGHVLGHSDYHWTHEPILYCRKKDNPKWFGDRTHKTVILNATIENLQDLKKEELINMIAEIRENSDIIREKKDPSNEYLHSTQKPVSLSQRMIKNSSKPKDLIFEPCAGSGSTLMACETSGRTCYAMELDPKYVDVILTRWAKFTEKEPIRESDGKKWSEL